MIYFSADHHFNHSNIIKFCNRPFKTVEEMNQVLIDNWNKVVKPNDQVYYLGDFCLGNMDVTERYMKSLRGQKFFIEGNHDYWFNEYIGTQLRDVFGVHYQKYYFVLCHYPMLEWPRKFHGSIHLHGHSHGTIPDAENFFDVGVDCTDYKPISIEEIISKILE